MNNRKRNYESFRFACYTIAIHECRCLMKTKELRKEKKNANTANRK